MANTWQQTGTRMRTWWETLSTNQRFAAMAGGMAGIAVIVALLFWATRPDYAVLYANLAGKDASAVVEHLREAKIPYRLGRGGTQVEIPASQIHEQRLHLAGKGIPRGEGSGFELFDKMAFGVTDEVQRINYLRALQSELERTIDSLESVEKSRVHLVVPKEELWIEDPDGPSASVMLKLTTGARLGADKVSGIRHLLASAVRGLKPERVTLVDTQGRILAASEDEASLGAASLRHLEYRQKVEEHLEKRAEGLLAEILGPGKAAVRVSAEMDFSSMHREREHYEPVVGGQGLVRSEKQNSLETGKTRTEAGGAAGTASNLQGYPPSAGVGGASSRQNERIVNYEMNRVVERVQNASGMIRSLSVGIFIDGKQDEAAIEAIRSVVATGLGILPERGDKLEVRALPFNRKAWEEEKRLLEESQKQQFWMQIATRWAPPLVLAAAGVAVFLFGFRQVQSWLQQGPDAESGQGRGGNGESLRNAEEILTLLKKHTGGSAQVMKHWLS